MPTLLGSYTSPISANASKSLTGVSADVGDVLVLAAAGMANETWANLPTGGSGLTWVRKQFFNGSAGVQSAVVWTATVTVALSNVTITVNSGGSAFGMVLMRFGAASGVGASTKTTSTAAPSFALTTTQANSSIVYITSDWIETNATTRTYRQINGVAPTETYYSRVVNYGRAWAAVYADAGAAGSKTVGVTVPSDSDSSSIAVEILGAAGPTADASPIALTTTLTAAGSIGKARPTTRSLGVSLTADGVVSVGPNRPATRSIAVGITTTHRKDTSGGVTRSLGVAITATGSVGKAGSASLSLGVGTSGGGIATRGASADRTMSVAITASGLAIISSPAPMPIGVAITASGYIASGAGTNIRWLRINGAWVRVPPA